jgi:biotin transport system substrate-specific component
MVGSTGALIDAVVPRPGARVSVLLRDTGIVLAASALMALLAQLTIPLPVVPVTGQTLGVLLIGASLGSKKGSLAMLAYLAEGALGAPVFAGGSGGIAVIAGPTAGYLYGFVVAAFVVGWLAERGFDRNLLTAAVAMLVGTVAMYAVALPWLSFYVPGDKLLSVGLIPFIPGNLVKLVLAAALLPTAWKLLGRDR